MRTPQIEAVAGTVIEEITRFEESPVGNPKYANLFHNGWWQIVITSNGKNPSFPARSWAVILVAPIDKDLDLDLTQEGLTTVFVAPDVEIVKVTTTVEVKVHEEIEWEFPAIILDLRSKTLGDDRLLLLCSDPEPIERPTKLN